MQATPIKKHEGERGWVSEIYSGELGAELQNIHLGTIEPGAIRGNHLHEASHEWITFLNTPVKIHYGKNGTTETLVLEEPTKLEFKPGEPHAFENCGDATVHFAAYRDHLYTDEDPDTEPERVVPQECREEQS